ncbi:MAG TPA: alcohol dehydrogenase catalytic domain-containing protein [Bryobacteraceae bacterium]
MSAAESVQTLTALTPSEDVPRSMRAAVYLGQGRIAVQSIDTPAIGRGEMLVRVESCGICHTDLKKIEYDLLAPPRVYGHETAGIVASVGSGVTRYSPGDRVVVFHHIPCRDCFFCHRRLYAQCSLYKKVGVTAGFEPAGGGFSQYVRVMDWIVNDGVEPIPEGVSFDQACWVEPVNTCLKAVHMLAFEPGDVIAVLGQGSIGLIFTMLAKRMGASVLATDGIRSRRELAERFGAHAYDPFETADGRNFEAAVKAHTDGRGADAVILAVSAPGLVEQALRISRPGAKILLFAQTSSSERIEIPGAAICVGERVLLGSYSADIDLQRESARLVFSGDLPLEQLISHRVPLAEIEQGIELCRRPSAESLKVVVRPQEQSAWQ